MKSDRRRERNVFRRGQVSAAASRHIGGGASLPRLISVRIGFGVWSLAAGASVAVSVARASADLFAFAT
jgi:predicted metalloprotease